MDGADFSRFGSPAEDDAMIEQDEIDPENQLTKGASSKVSAIIPGVPEGTHGATVGELVDYLFSCFPEQYCEPWDRCGLLVGNSTAPVHGVAIALDPWVTTIHRAADAGCNVLLTHHPAYLDAPDRLVDRQTGGGDPAARAIAAIERGVSLVAMHTNLDRSPLAIQVLLSEYGLDHEGEMMPSHEGLPGFGCLGTPPRSKGEMTLSDLAERCIDADGRRPRVWGDPDLVLGTVAIANGSSSSLMSAIVGSGADCVITGEMSYHAACELVSFGIGLIELGHDVSERPLLECLRETVESNPAFAFNVRMMDPGIGWWQPRMEER